jgi:hypothetical protein
MIGAGVQTDLMRSRIGQKFVPLSGNFDAVRDDSDAAGL